MFLNNPSKILKQFNKDKYEYVLYHSDKKECASISSGTLVHTEDIVAFGESKTMDLVTANSVLPDPTFIHNLITKGMENTYKCWCCEKLNVDQFVGHKTSLNSWDCLIQTIGNPEYVVIVQRKVKSDEGTAV